MQIRRFEAKDVQEALRQVKEALGPEAIILSTKTVKKPSDRLNRGRQSVIEVVAATDCPDAPQRETSAAFFRETLSSLPAKRGEERKATDSFVDRILSLGLHPPFAQGLVDELRHLRKESGGWNFAETYRGFLQLKLMEAIEVIGSDLKERKIWAFVGPTGVGKTTTIAKLAAHYSLRLQKRVSLITIDTYRIGAIEQLKTYARILRLPLEVAPDPETLTQVIAEHGDQDLLLIDTAGRNPHQAEKLEDLKRFLTADPRIENHLVLSATTKEADMARIVECFRLLPIRSYLFSKIDETAEYLSLFNQLLRYKRPLSYLTNGQKVPEDIEFPTKGSVASLIMRTLQWN